MRLLAAIQDPANGPVELETLIRNDAVLSYKLLNCVNSAYFNLPRKLKYRGSRGSDPEDGDLIYFVPWGNLGFYYNAAGIGYSDQTIHLGTYQASPEKLEQLEGQSITVEVAH